MDAARADAMRRGAQHFEERRKDAAVAPGVEPDAHEFTRKRKRDGKPETPGTGKPVAGGGELFDLDVDDLGHGPRRHFTSRSSTSKTSVAFGGITPPAPCAP